MYGIVLPPPLFPSPAPHTPVTPDPFTATAGAGAGVVPAFPLSSLYNEDAVRGRGSGDGGVSGAALAAAIQFLVTAQSLLDEPWPKQAALHDRARFDFIVVGGGTGGSLLAARLAEEPRFRVLLVEAGPDPPKEAIIPGYHSTLIGGPFDWNLTTVGDPDGASQALRGGSQSQPRGKLLGGCGSLNDMIYARGYPPDYDHWARTLGDDWAWDNVLPYFKKTEHVTDEKIINNPELMKLHGRGGPIEVSGFNASTFDTKMFLNAFEECGFQKVEDINNPNKIGAGRPSHTIRNGRRDSTVTALLNKAADKKNLYVLKEAIVTRILMHNKTAFGVNVIYNNNELQFYATKEVIISAGTFNTPKLLMLSGIGPQEHLNQMGINVVQDLPVGENLHDHVMVLNYIAADNGTCYFNEAKSYMSIVDYLYDKSGPLSYINSMAAYMALNNSANTNVPDFAFYPTCMPIGTRFYDSCVRLLRLNETICLNLQDLLKDHELMSIAVVLLKPKSRGRVKLRSTDPLDDPLIYAGTFSDPEDLNDFPEAIAVVDKIAASSYFQAKNARVVDLKIEGCDVLSDEAAVRCRARATAMSAWHAAGTAPMGAVLDGRLRVRGVRRLRVVDASVMPQVIRGNTNAPVVMIAEKAADFIKADHG